MKIVVKGVDPAQLPFHLACEKCSTVIEVTKEELNKHQENRNEGDCDFINCPVCKNFIYDTPRIRAKALEVINQQNNHKKQKTNSSDVYMDAHRTDPRGDDFNPYGYWNDPPKRSGGPTGPCPPPELPLLPCIKKAAHLAK